MALKSEAIMCGHNGYKTGDDSIIVLTGSPSTLPHHEAPESIDLNAFHNMDLNLVYLERNVMTGLMIYINYSLTDTVILLEITCTL